MLIGVDFDNTLVCYDELFYRAAVERRLIPPELSPRKELIRDFFRRSGREDDWTMLQGHVYGKAIAEAPPFPGAIEFFAACRSAGAEIRIVSHRTRYPVLGPRHDLHSAAVEWLRANGFFDEERTGLTPARTHFEETRRGKLDRISALGCAWFIDDLPELLSDPEFPGSVRRVLFDPHGTGPAEARFEKIGGWPEAISLLRAG